jgi:hypothetical protein
VLVSELVVCIFAGFAFTYREWVLTSKSPQALDSNPMIKLAFAMACVIWVITAFIRVYTLLIRYR